MLSALYITSLLLLSSYTTTLPFKDNTTLHFPGEVVITIPPNTKSNTDSITMIQKDKIYYLFQPEYATFNNSIHIQKGTCQAMTSSFQGFEFTCLQNQQKNNSITGAVLLVLIMFTTVVFSVIALYNNERIIRSYFRNEILNDNGNGNGIVEDKDDADIRMNTIPSKFRKNQYLPLDTQTI